MSHPSEIEKAYPPMKELATSPTAVSYAPSSEDVEAIKQSRIQYLKWYFTSKEGWIGDYVSSFHSVTRKHVTYLVPFFFISLLQKLF
jgi:hypothetical protein